MEQKKNFKKNDCFLFGVATAAYQVEGAWNIDGRESSIWDKFSQTEGNVHNNDNGNEACGHYYRVNEDTNLIKNLGVNAYRLSMSWSRLLPQGIGQENDLGVAFYDRLIDKLLLDNIQPWVTLYHWDLPLSLQEKGGWQNRDVMGWFSEYADLVQRKFGDRVQNFIVINEPSITSYLGHYLGIFAPGIKNIDALYTTTHHQNLVIGSVTKQLQQSNKANNVGSSYTYFPVYPSDPSKALDNNAAHTIDRIWTRNFVDPVLCGEYPIETLPHLEGIIRADDMKIINVLPNYLGINHYSPNYAEYNENELLKASLTSGPEGDRTDIGWIINEQDLKKSLMEIRDRYNNIPVYVTENGMCENSGILSNGEINDIRRIDYMNKYLDVVLDCQSNHDCDIRGYFAWSLMDNFEWAHGYEMRFGLVHVDYKTLTRTPKKSYEWYRNKINSYKEGRS
jgi:beta-glucosidase